MSTSASQSLGARISQAFARLTDREKRLVLLTGAVALVLLFVFVSSLISGALTGREKRVAMRRDEIAQLDGMRVRYEEAVQAEERSKRRITSNTASLFSLLQKSATEVGLPLGDLNERRLPVKDSPDLVEVTVDMNFKEVSVDKLNMLLEKIEGKRNDGVVKVTKLKVKTRFDNPEMLEAALTVSTWKAASNTQSGAEKKP